MKQLHEIKLGIYEKALPFGTGWAEKLRQAEEAGFHFIEMSIDETDHRLERLDWSPRQRREFRESVAESPLTVPSICLSGHRRFPLGSHDPEVRRTAREISAKAIHLAVDLGVRTIQLAGYDVYYEESDKQTRAWFLEGLEEALHLAARENVMLAVEIMDYPLFSSIVKYLNYERLLGSPWFTVYPDLGNLSAWGNDVPSELELGIRKIAAVHVKETLAVTADFPGKFKEVPFGSGCVDFAGAFAKLAELNYSGPFLIEMWTEKAENPLKEVKEARRWVLDRMREGGYLDDK